MGSGRTELVRALFGLDPYSSGAVRMCGELLQPGDVQQRLDAGVAFLTEDRRMEGLLPDAAVADNMALAALPRFAAQSWRSIRRRELMRSIRSLGRKLNLKSGDLPTTPIRTLSGGNQQKVILGRWLLREPKLFILDEPTRGVDVGAKQEIYRLLVQMADEGMAILVISSELEELMGLCDRILVLRQGEVCGECDRARFNREALLKAAFGHGEEA
jgi:ABC-type sugar transport system ATPase subunit